MKKLIILIGCAIIILAGCDHAPRTSGDAQKTPETVVIEGAEGDYQTVVPQPISPSRGVVNPETNANTDIDYMERGLVEISKQYVSPDDYLYEPGQAITSEDAKALVGRQYTETQMQEELAYNPEAQNIGLNPVLPEGTDPKDSPIYVQSIVEQDYFTFDENGNKVVHTVAIGISFDPTYTYTDAEGNEVTKEISDDELNQYANSLVANQMTEFIRSKEGYEDVNIVYGFFKASDSELYPGTYISQGYTPSGSNTLEDKKVLNNQNVSFPSEKGNQIDPTLNTEIQTLVNTINKYFPYTTGVYAVGAYTNNQLQQLTIYVNVNTYSAVDVVPFVNYIEKQISTTITQKVPIRVEVKKPTGESQAILVIDENGNSNKYIY